MPTPATIEDAKLVLHLYEMRRESRLREARKWFAAEAFFPNPEDMARVMPVGSSMHESFRMVTTYWEMVASLLNFGALHKELYYQSGREMLFCFERLRHLLPTLRANSGNPKDLHNLEKAATEFIEYWKADAPGAYEAFCKRVRRE